MKIFVVGSINMDLVIKAPFMPENGVTISGNDFMQNPGGKGANQAVACAKLGGASYMVGNVGNAFGDQLEDTLASYGVNTSYVSKDMGVSSGIAVIVVVDGDNRIILDSGANYTIKKENVEIALNDAEEGDYLITQLEVPSEIVKFALEMGKQKGLITVLNPAPATKLIDGILENVDYFIPNQSECEFYSGIYPINKKLAIKAANVLKNKGVKNVVITLGENGSCTITENSYISVDAYKVDAIDTTAAGDTYIGAFVTALSSGKNIEEAMKFASKASSITVTRRGAQQSIPYLNEL